MGEEPPAAADEAAPPPNALAEDAAQEQAPAPTAAAEPAVTEPAAALVEGTDDSTAVVAGLQALAGEADAAADATGQADLRLPADDAAGREYRIKCVKVFDRDVAIVLQNLNGPCPLLAIANALILRGTLKLNTSGPLLVPHSELVALVAATLLEGGASGSDARPLDANQQQNISDAVAALPKLATGLDVNVRFTAVDAFEFTGETAIFDLLRLPLVHGWLVDPADAVTAAAVGTMSYNELVERLVGGAAPAEQAAALEHFLEFSASQLTQYGLAILHSRVADGTLCVFFRNNHFCTAYKHRGGFYLLVTDEGYREQAQLVWEALSHVGGDTSYHTGAFEPFVAPPPRAVDAAGGMDALTEAAAVAAAGGAPPVSEEERATLRMLQEEEDMRTAQMLSQQLTRHAAGSAGGVGAAAAAGGDGDGFEFDSAATRSAGAAGGSGGGDMSRDLFEAVEKNDLDRAMVALASGQDINARDVLGRTPLHWAASEGREEIAQMLIANEARLGNTDDNGHTPLHLAALAGAAPLVRLLLDAGSRPDLRDQAGKTPAQLATVPAVVSLLQTHPSAVAAAQRAAAQAAQSQLSAGSAGRGAPSSPASQQRGVRRSGQRVGRTDEEMEDAEGASSDPWQRVKKFFQR